MNLPDPVVPGLEEGVAEAIHGISPWIYGQDVDGNDVTKPWSEAPLSVKDRYRADARAAVQVCQEHYAESISTYRAQVAEDSARIGKLQLAVDRAYSDLYGSQYVGAPSWREAWRSAVEALSEVVTRHRGAVLKEPSDAS